MEPRDIEFASLPLLINAEEGPSISSPHPTGPVVAFASREPGAGYRLIAPSTPADTLRGWLTFAAEKKEPSLVKDVEVGGN